MTDRYFKILRDENQALGIGRYAVDFLAGKLGTPSDAVLNKTEAFHRDSIACGVAALGIGTNAPTLLRKEALAYRCDDSKRGVPCFASGLKVFPEKAVAANCSAVRELDANGTNFGYNKRTGYRRGEFGHNDFYPVAVAAAQIARLNGRELLYAMVCLDEIRGVLAEVYALKDHKIDHVLHCAIASAAVFGAVLGASAEQIESAIGLVVSHYVPFRAIRHGTQLSDSKGASAALAAETAVLSMQRAMHGFLGPGDIFRNPQAVFSLFEPPEKAGESPFDLEFACEGDDFAVMGMHFKLGLYEHQSAGAIGGLIDLLSKNPRVLEDIEQLVKIRIAIYEPAFSIIGDPTKRDPRTRQSADHSMVFIIAALLRKAYEKRLSGWSELMLLPEDYSQEALCDPTTRRLMELIEFVHGGADFDSRYPEGIPTKLSIEHRTLGRLSSGLVMYPHGHARNQKDDLEPLLVEKFHRLASLGSDDPDRLFQQFSRLTEKNAEEIQGLYDFRLRLE